jgi:hypothetical protein
VRQITLIHLITSIGLLLKAEATTYRPDPSSTIGPKSGGFRRFFIPLAASHRLAYHP